MKIVVIGGTGLVGSGVVSNLAELGHDAIPASPRLGIDTITGEGVREACPIHEKGGGTNDRDDSDFDHHRR